MARASKRDAAPITSQDMPQVETASDTADSDASGSDTRVWARRKSARMFEILEAIAENGDAPAPSRVSAAQTIIEHGHGKNPAAVIEPGSSSPGPADHKPDLAGLRDRVAAETPVPSSGMNGATHPGQ